MEKNKIEGKYNVGKGRELYLNSATGAGFKDLLVILKPHLVFQAKNIDFPSYSKEDLEQEMLRMAWEALPKYDPTKNTNLITFLTNHMKNRLINMCKFYAQKRRNASFLENPMIKVRCNSCRSFFKAKRTIPQARCGSCGATGELESPLFNIYNIALTDQQTKLDDAAMPEISFDNQGFAAISSFGSAITSDDKMDLEILFKDESSINKSIIDLVVQGYTQQEIAVKLDIAPKMVSQEIKTIFGRIRKKSEKINEHSPKQNRQEKQKAN